MPEKQKTLCPDCNSDNYRWLGYDDECKCLDCSCVFNATAEQKTCLGFWKEDADDKHILMDKDEPHHTLSKAKTFPAVQKSEHDKLKEELKRVEWSYDTLYKLHEELKLEFENSIPKEKVRKVLDKVENKWPLCNKSEIFIDIKKQLLGEKK